MASSGIDFTDWCGMLYRGFDTPAAASHALHKAMQQGKLMHGANRAAYYIP